MNQICCIDVTKNTVTKISLLKLIWFVLYHYNTAFLFLAVTISGVNSSLQVSALLLAVRDHLLTVDVRSVFIADATFYFVLAVYLFILNKWKICSLHVCQRIIHRCTRLDRPFVHVARAVDLSYTVWLVNSSKFHTCFIVVVVLVI